MFRYVLLLTLFCIVGEHFSDGCLITNCPRGGKRNGKLNPFDSNIKQCISCGPARAGQCFGPSICCGPFGCLVGTPDTLRCLKEGQFLETEPCIAGNSSCRRNTGRCAADGICCSQESCHTDKSCLLEDRQREVVPVDLYNFFGYPNVQEYNSD